jgi:hypothetical protein
VERPRAVPAPQIAASAELGLFSLGPKCGGRKGTSRTDPPKSGFSMLPFAVAMLAFPYVGRLLGSHYLSAHLLTLGLIVVGLGNALTALGAHRGAWSIVMVGMLVLGRWGPAQRRDTKGNHECRSS